MLYENIARLVQYGISTGLLPECERIYATNLLLEVFGEDNFEEVALTKELPLEVILQALLDEACARNLIDDNITERDLFDTKLMNCLMPRPAQIQAKFQSLYTESPEAATDYYYNLSQDSDYIRRYRIAKDVKWEVES